MYWNKHPLIFNVFRMAMYAFLSCILQWMTHRVESCLQRDGTLPRMSGKHILLL